MRKEYNAVEDPYCPYTRSDGFKKHMKERLKIEKISKMSKSQTFDRPLSDLQPQLKPMGRPISAPDEYKFPKHQVSNVSFGESGMTFSAEPAGQAAEGMAELEVLKAILNRESYLARLIKSARTVSRKFKPEIADIMDLVRAASLDVVEAVVKWRDAKNDHHAAFMWNGVNYLLKMPSDLDYLDNYRAIRTWMGFRVKRNPFCVPYPLEEGAKLLSKTILQPKHIEGNEGFTIGGMLLSNYSDNYALKDGSFKSVFMGSPYKGKLPPASGKLNLTGNGAVANSTGAPAGETARSGADKQATGASMPSYILNEDMMLLRQAEMVILKEEEKLGIYSLDPDGRLVPALQAETLHIAKTLVKDNRRDMVEKTTTAPYAAIHAGISDVGYEEEPWDPSEIQRADEENARRAGEDELAAPVDPLDKWKDPKRGKDHSLLPHKKGRDKSGGALLPLGTRSADASIRLPLKPKNNAGNEIQFHANRKKKTIGDRLNQITELRDKIAREMAELEASKKKDAYSPTRMKSKKQKSNSLLAAAVSNAMDASGVIAVGGGNGAARVLGRGDSNRTLRDSSDSRLPQDTDDDVSVASITSNKSDKSDGSGRSKTVKRRSIRESRDSVDEPAPRELTEKEIRINEEVAEVAKAYNKVDKHGEKLVDLKENQRVVTQQERSREIERKRRLLSAEEGRRRGPPSENEPESVYDYYAIIAQTAIRGWLARRYYAWYKVQVVVASTLMQMIVRGCMARIRVGRLLVNSRAAVVIQRSFRGMSARNSCAAMARDYRIAKAAIQIQKIYRGVLAKKRVQKKRELDKAAKLAVEAVNPKNLFVQDVQELATRIQMAIEEPLTTEYPPDEVLHLIRLATVLLLSGEGQSGLTTYSRIGARYFEEVEGEKLTWEQAMKVVNRPNRFMRRVRAMAFAPVSKPPRLVRVTEAVHTLYKAQQNNPKWTIETFETMGRGSKICCQLFRWMSSMIEVALAQEAFVAFLVENFPEWLPEFLELQAISRKCEWDIHILEGCVEALVNKREIINEEDTLHKLYTVEINELQFEIADAQRRLVGYHEKEDEMRSNQSSVEDGVLIALNEKLTEKEESLAAITTQYEALVEGAEAGDRLMEAKMPEFRAKLITAQIEHKELRSQFSLLKLQVENNRNLRLDPCRLPPHVAAKARAHGEARAILTETRLKMRAMLVSAGLKYDHQLSKIPGAYEFYKDLERKEGLDKVQFRLTQKSAQFAHEEHNVLLRKYATEKDRTQKVDKAQFVPSQAEMQEERQEDDIQAKAERLKKRQFVPNDVLFDAPNRPRPLILAFGRDCSAFSKNKIIYEIRKSMPGVFVHLDLPNKMMGLDLTAMQDVLDAKKSILMTVDHGLTRIARVNFLKMFETVTQALIPKPYIVFVSGDERNKRMPEGDQQYGVSRTDMAAMADSDIKTCLERLAWLRSVMLTDDMRNAMIDQSHSATAPSTGFIAVMEAFFIIQADHDRFRQPDYHIASVSWRATQVILRDPLALVSKLTAVKRGRASAHMCNVLMLYLAHRAWPAPSSSVRQQSPLLNLIALYVESWTECERLSLERGGVPEKAMLKGSVLGMQAAIIVEDGLDEDDELEVGRRGGWKVAFAQILKGCLQDMRVLKLVQKIDDKMYNVNVYREEGTIYFDSYDPANSQMYSTTVEVSGVPNLLVPNTTASSTGFDKQHKDPPLTPKEMYLRLAKLLRFEKASKRYGARQVLLCRRDNTFLCGIKRKIGGHRLLISAYEAALGELYFVAYFPETSSRIHLMIDDDSRLRLMKNSDPSLEFHISETNLASEILPYVLDRLTVFPSKRCFELQKLNRIAANEVDLAAMRAIKTQYRGQGMKLKLRVVGGAGCLLVQEARVITGIPVVLSYYLSSFSNTLRVVAYEPRSRSTVETRITAVERKMILGGVSKDINQWKAKLVPKLRLRWNHSKNDFELKHDTLLYKAMRIISLRRSLLSLHILDESSFSISVLDIFTSEQFVSKLSKEDAIRIVSYDIPIPEQDDKSKKRSNKRVQKDNGIIAAVKNLLRYMLGDKNKNVPIAEQAQAAAVTEEDDFDTTVLDLPIEELFPNKEMIARLVDQIANLLERKDPLNYRAGYTASVPVPLYFKMQQKSDDQQDLEDQKLLAESLGGSGPVDLLKEFRHTPRLVQRQRESGLDGDYLRARRQLPILNLEVELNALAHRRSVEARELELANEAAAKALEEKLIADVAQPFQDEYVDPIEGVNHIKTPREEESADDERLAVKQRNMDIVDRRNTALDLLLTDIADTASIIATDEIISKMEEKEARRVMEREAPGTIQEEYLRTKIMSSDGKTELNICELDLPDEEKAIISRRADKLVLEMGIKTNFREGKARWHGHVSIRIFEGLSFDSVHGVGRRFRILVFDPFISQEFEGIIRSTKHLHEILGIHGKDLLDKNRTTEMLMFICRQKLDMVNNSTTWDGEPNDPGAPAYRIEFQTDRLYDNSKITPANQGGSADEQANADKNILSADKRGKKILRAAKRVSGVLLQLIVFELPMTEEEEHRQFQEELERERKEEAAIAAAEKPALGSSDTVRPATAVTEGTVTRPGTGVVSPGDDDDEFVSTRPKRRPREKLAKYFSPSFRIVGYDPRSKGKCTYVVTHEATAEIAGGSYSQFLEVSRRRELARIVCDGLQCIFDKGSSFQLYLPFAGGVAVATGAPPIEKRSVRASSEQIMHRPGKIFRSAMRISNLDLLITIYAIPPGNTVGSEQYGITVNFYIPVASETVDVPVSERIQTEYLGNPLVKIQEGLPRAMAIRKLCHYFKADLRDDRKNLGAKILEVELLPLKSGFIQEYEQIGVPKPGQDIRPVGIPAVFMPPDTCGILLHRRGARLYDEVLKEKSDKEYVISVYTKSALEGCERGLVVKVYEQHVSGTMILHIGPSEIKRLVEKNDQWDLLRDIASAKGANSDSARDPLEANFETLTEKSENLRQLKKMYDLFTDIIISDVGIKPDPVGEPSLYLMTAKTEPV